MIIQDLIADIVATMSVEDSSPSVAPTFLHGSRAWSNLKVDEVTNDIVILDEPITSTDNFRKSNLLEENYNLNILFLTKTEYQDLPENIKPDTSRMRNMRRKFIIKASNYEVDGQKQIKEISGIKTLDTTDLFNANFSGVLLSITITPINPLSSC